MLRLKIRLAKGSRSKDFWKACKDYSGMGTQRRKAAPPTEALAKYFASKMNLPGEEGKEVPPLEQAPPGARRLRGFKVTRAKVSKVLRALDESKSVGPDGVSPRVLKHCAKELDGPLARLFQKVERAAVFPDSWKVARVTPVYKKGDATDPKNYRPVSVLPTLATTFERVLMPQLSSFLYEHIPPEQFGFLRGTGTADVGVIIADQIARSLEARKDVRLVALDFKGAFDKVWWRGLLEHLWAVGVRGRAFKLFQSYLSGRSLFVVANGEASDRVQINSGVPQGAIWSPLLFNLFVRNVPAEVKEALCLFYADDLTLMMEIQKGEEGEAAQKLDEDLARLHNWGDQWLLEFEATKSQSLLVSNKREESKAQHRPLSMGGFTVEEKEQLKALGFIIDPKGNWSLHVQQTAADARKRLGAIRRVAHLLDNQGIMMAYKAFVRSKIEYGNLVYWGAANTNLGMLDKVQQSAISLLDDPEPSLLPCPLERRREAAAVGLLVKVLDGEGRGRVNELKPERMDPSQTPLRRSTRLAAAKAPPHHHQLRPAPVHNSNSLETYRRSWGVRIPQVWNNLDYEVLHQQQHIENFTPLRKQLQRHMTMSAKQQ
jgi:hypothetical protein